MKHAYFHTTKGEFVVALNDEKAPLSVANFLHYVRTGFYNGTIFHRVIDGFMVQGGGMEPGLKQKVTIEPIQNEANNGLKNMAYSLAFARTNDPHSANAQFFINVADNAFLDHRDQTPQGWGYAVFGEVISGRETIDIIRRVKTGNKGFHQDVPVEDVVITLAAEWDNELGAIIQPGEDAGVEVAAEAEPELGYTIPGNDPVYYKKGFQIATHEVEGAASNLAIYVGDDANIGTNANHRYDIVGFNTAGNPAEDADGASQVLSILFQNGPIPQYGNNGITIEALLALCAHRLEGFQDGPFACVENGVALDHVNGALEALKSRTAKRVVKGVEGTEQKH